MGLITLGRGQRRTAAWETSIDILVGPCHGVGKDVGAIHASNPPGAVTAPDDHGASDAVLIPLADELLFFGTSQVREEA